MSAFARKVILNAPVANGENFADKLAALDRRLSIVEISMSRRVDGRTRSSVAVNVSEK